MALAHERLRIFVLTENIFAQLHVSAAQFSEKYPDAFLGSVSPPSFEIVYIDIDADGAHDSEFLVINRDGRAFKSPRPDIEQTVEAYLRSRSSALLQIDQQIGRAVTQMSAGDIVLQTNEGMRRISQIMQQNFHSDVWK